jgi:hypothetical protein
MLAFDYNGDRLERLNAAVAEACPGRGMGQSAEGSGADRAKGQRAWGNVQSAEGRASRRSCFLRHALCPSLHAVDLRLLTAR